jgi:hypothetical protein
MLRKTIFVGLAGAAISATSAPAQMIVPWPEYHPGLPPVVPPSEGDKDWLASTATGPDSEVNRKYSARYFTYVNASVCHSGMPADALIAGINQGLAVVGGPNAGKAIVSIATRDGPAHLLPTDVAQECIVSGQSNEGQVRTYQVVWLKGIETALTRIVN